jgi:hypothetical protein
MECKYCHKALKFNPLIGTYGRFGKHESCLIKERKAEVLVKKATDERNRLYNVMCENLPFGTRWNEFQESVNEETARIERDYKNENAVMRAKALLYSMQSLVSELL